MLFQSHVMGNMTGHMVTVTLEFMRNGNQSVRNSEMSNRLRIGTRSIMITYSDNREKAETNTINTDLIDNLQSMGPSQVQSGVNSNFQKFILGYSKIRKFEGSLDQSHFIFKINAGKRRIRHRTTLNLIQSILSRSSNSSFNF